MRPNSKNQTHCQKREDHIRLILDLIEKEPSLFEKYSFSSGTGEQYTIFEHSRLVLKTAEQFKAQLEPMITPLSWNNFRFSWRFMILAKDMLFKSIKAQIHFS